MTIDIPDLTSLSLVSFFAFLLLVAAIDTGTAIVLALVRGTFSTAYVMTYLRTHVLLRVFPIFGLALVGHGIAQLSIPAVAAAWAAAGASLVGYIVETIGSLRDSFATSTPPISPPATVTPPAP